jgi:hypothetical protein
VPLSQPLAGCANTAKTKIQLDMHCDVKGTVKAASRLWRRVWASKSPLSTPHVWGCGRWAGRGLWCLARPPAFPRPASKHRASASRLIWQLCSRADWAAVHSSLPSTTMSTWTDDTFPLHLSYTPSRRVASHCQIHRARLPRRHPRFLLHSPRLVIRRYRRGGACVLGA